MREEKRIVQAGYDRIAKAYTDARLEMKESNRRYLESLLARLRPNSHILDIGCGSGVPITKFLLSMGHRVTGVDVSASQVERAKTLVPEATLVEGDIMQVSFPARVFDAAVSFYAIIHIPRDEHRTLFQRVHRMLRKGGVLLATLGSDAWVGLEVYKPFGVPMYWSHFDRDAYLQMLPEAGFRVLRSSIEREEFLGEQERTLYVLVERLEPPG